MSAKIHQVPLTCGQMLDMQLLIQRHTGRISAADFDIVRPTKRRLGALDRKLDSIATKIAIENVARGRRCAAGHSTDANDGIVSENG